MHDLELGRVPTTEPLINDVVDNFAWRDIHVLVKDRSTKSPLYILSETAGLVHAGEMLAIMGPSGSGKTTLLNALAHRIAAAGAETTGQILVNGQKSNSNMIRNLSAYVEQEDALIGSVTVRETMVFSARLALPSDAPDYFSRIGYQIPAATNPAEFFLDLINIDLDKNGEIKSRTQHIINSWKESPECNGLEGDITRIANTPSKVDLTKLKLPKPSIWMVPLTLLHRSWVKSYRDIVAYHIRIIMYLGLAVLMGTVFLRLKLSQEYIQPFVNAIFFSGAFISFMAVAYVPAYLEDLHTFQSERANGLVGPLSFMVSNFLIGLPFLFTITLIFSVVVYWLSNFRADGPAFMMWVLWLFLDLLAAESLVVLVSNIFPIFVVALAVAAFANGLWMAVDGFLVPMTILNSFWKYVFHYIDYQAYVFQGMMVNEFKDRIYTCAQIPDGGYQCMYPSSLNSQGEIRGVDVLKSFNIRTGLEGQWVGIMIGIIAGYRILAYLSLRFLR
ncbi:unnamed protein product [Parascedosporium putredinis]|uniref:ABC transporter domain-containing protein n=1 Tax=Parascedosporium putredinis TaxID=1442378 RepID=A0A9P1MC59_9PEZI|nr:unnamed protein product [Parascedosporium putredinis]CAI7997063.1 unnamed protein product [Parascedosporium putredinis]